MKILIVNGSYRENGTTAKCLKARAAKVMEREGISEEPAWLGLPDGLRACSNCGLCRKSRKCPLLATDGNFNFQGALEQVLESSHLLIGSPVYLDFPSPKLLAFLSRLSGVSETSGRRAFSGKKAFLHANGYVSGTKTVIGTLMRACEMLGFDIPGRSTSEYIEAWADLKIRGGFSGEASWLTGDKDGK